MTYNVFSGTLNPTQSICGWVIVKVGMDHSTCRLMCGWQLLYDPSLTHAIPECLRNEPLLIKCYANEVHLLFICCIENLSTLCPKKRLPFYFLNNSVKN